MFDNFPTYDPSAAPMQEEDTRANLEALWRQVFKADALTEAQRYPYRVRAVHRIVRSLAITLGAMSPSDLLGTGIPNNPFTETLHIDMHKGRQAAPQQEHVRQLFVKTEALNLAPPTAPNPMPSLYNPLQHRSQDPAFADWYVVLTLVSEYLQIDQGSIEDSDQGWLGTSTFVTPHDVRRTWPLWEHIVEFDMFVVQNTLEEYSDNGEDRARKELHSKYGYRPSELSSMVEAARALAISRTSFDVDFHKSLAIRRLEDIARRAKTALNLNAELRALKELHLVVGLGKVSPEDSFQMFTEAVTSLALEGRQTPALKQSLKALPPMLEAEVVHPRSIEYAPEPGQIERSA